MKPVHFILAFTFLFFPAILSAQPCNTGADEPANGGNCDGVVNITELMDYINLWYGCSSCYPDFFQAIEAFYEIPCVPDCAGKECGPDGCGGSCGVCNTGNVCNSSGQCIEAASETTISITQYGMTWTFDKEVVYGTFANGDYWVIGPVNITSITPDFDGEHHGWEASPLSTGPQGFDARISGFDSGKVPDLPYEAQPGKSIIKSVSIEPLGESCRPCLETAAVLTVLGEIPPDNGKSVFRPPYFGEDKPFYFVSDLNTDLLPSLEHPSNAPSLESIEESFSRVQLDHRWGWTGRFMHPRQHMPDYGSSVSNHNSRGALGLLLNDSIDDKMPALINYVQAGIDLYDIVKGGGGWPPNGGHSPGRKLPITFAAVLFESQEMKDAVSNAEPNIFDEDGSIEYSQKANDGKGMALFAQTGPWESNYWQKLVFGCDGVAGSKTHKDPYAYIDGGCCCGCTYDNCCLYKPWKATAIALYMMPELRVVWDDEEFLEYVNRRTYHGAWAQPDPCAPVTGVCAGGTNEGADCTAPSASAICVGDGAFCNYSAKWDSDYGVKYGPDGNGSCILDTDPSDGIGRYPRHDGLNKNSGGYGNSFAESLWEMYRHIHCYNGVQDEDEEGIDCGGSCVSDLDGDGYDGRMCDILDPANDCDDDCGSNLPSR